MMDWIKLYAPKVLRGTMAGEPLVYQAIWVRLMCLANEVSFRDGTLRFPPNWPMTREYISTYCRIPLDQLNEALDYFMNEVNTDPNSTHYGKARLQELDGGVLFLTNFEESQSIPDGKKLIPETFKEREYREKRRIRRDVRKYPKDAQEAMKEALNKERLESQATQAVEKIKKLPLEGGE